MMEAIGNAYMLLIVGLLVGPIVSLDVSAYELSQLRNNKEISIKSASRHAFWHAAFLAIGIGIFEIIGGLLSVVFEGLINWLSSLELNWPWELHIYILKALAHAPQWIMLGIGLVLFFLLYREKISAAATGEDPEPPKWAKNLPAKHIAAIAVALDMWQLTPLLKVVVENATVGASLLSKLAIEIAFIGEIFLIVFIISYFVITWGRRQLESKLISPRALFWLLTTLLLAEPFFASIVAVRTIEIVYFFGTGQQLLVYSFFSFIFLLVLTKHYGFNKICNGKWEEASQVV